MDVDGCSKSIYGKVTKSRKETSKSLKTLALLTCVLLFSHTDEIGYAVWATYSCAVLSFLSYIVMPTMKLYSIILMGVVTLELLFELITRCIHDGAIMWKDVNRFPPNTTHIRPIGTRVGFFGERTIFGGRSSTPRIRNCYLGYVSLVVLSMLNDIALAHKECIELACNFLYVCTTGLLYPLEKLYTDYPTPPHPPHFQSASRKRPPIFFRAEPEKVVP